MAMDFSKVETALAAYTKAVAAKKAATLDAEKKGDALSNATAEADEARAAVDQADQIAELALADLLRESADVEIVPTEPPPESERVDVEV